MNQIFSNIHTVVRILPSLMQKVPQEALLDVLQDLFDVNARPSEFISLHTYEVFWSFYFGCICMFLEIHFSTRSCD